MCGMCVVKQAGCVYWYQLLYIKSSFKLFLTPYFTLYCIWIYYSFSIYWDVFLLINGNL